MCCFSGPVQEVHQTRIFARAVSAARQVLVYQMKIATEKPVAMILPLPVPKNSQQDDLVWINLKPYPTFFKDLEVGFDLDISSPVIPGDLKRYQVGDYDASFAPTLKDMYQLHKDFELSIEVWENLPAYKDYGFAIFQLKPGRTEAHPMAFEFPRRVAESENGKLFFPTVHIHDGKVHKTAEFDHLLYLQRAPEARPLVKTRWLESPKPVNTFLNLEQTGYDGPTKQKQSLVDPTSHAHRAEFIGRFKNVDILI